MSRMRVAQKNRQGNGVASRRKCSKTGENRFSALGSSFGLILLCLALFTPGVLAADDLLEKSRGAGTCDIDTTQPDFQAGTPFNVVLPPAGDVELASSLTIDQKNENLSGNGGTFHHFWWYGQTFTAGVSGPLTAVEVRLFCSGCFAPPPDVRISIRAVDGSGKPTNVDLTSTTIPGFTSIAAQWYRATFPSPITMNAGTKYAIVVRSTAPYSGQYAYLYSAANSTYSGGERYTSTTAGNSWIQQNFDTGFRVFTGGGFVAAGHLDSSLKDSNPGGAQPVWETISWSDSTPGGTDVEFQAAGSNSPGGPFNFVGPDGTPGTRYTTSGGDLSQFNGFRYLKYKALLSTGNPSNTPTLHDATVCYDTVVNEADLSISKTDGETNVTPGESVSYTIIAGNTGPSDAPNATVTDTFPPELSNCSWTCFGSGGGSCPSSGSGNINASVSLPVFGSAFFTATCDINPGATGTLSNTASVTSPLPDPQPANNDATDNSNIDASADLSITKTDGASSSVPGGLITYTITASNAGPSPEPNATVTDTFGPDLQNCSWTCSDSGGGSCPSSGFGHIDELVNLPVGGSVSFSATCEIHPNASGTLSNTANVNGPAPDPNNGNNSDTDNNSLSAEADLWVIKDDFATSSLPGGTITYDITAGNFGPSNVNSATVIDNFNGDLVNCSWTCLSTGGASCSTSGAGNINENVGLPVDSSVIFTVDCDIAAGASGTLSNTASVSSPVFDPDGSNDSDTDNNSLDGEADLSISKTDGETTVTPGESVTYTITAGNTGPSDATNATVIDNFPSELSNCSWTCLGSGGGSCPTSGSGDINASVSLPVFGSVLFTATCDINGNASGTLSNTAVISSTLGDPQPGNNSATDNSDIEANADLSITKTDGTSTQTPGESVTYTIVASNAGPTNASDALVQDSFPGQLQNCNWTCLGSGGGICPASGSGDINHNVNLPVGANVTFTATCDIDPVALGTLSNTATVSSTQVDPVLGNNTAVDNSNLVPEADLGITKSDGASSSIPGNPISYTIIASNFGPSHVGDATVTDTFSSDLNNCSWTCSGSGGGSCAASGVGNINTGAILPVDGSVTLIANCEIDDGATGTLSNTASVSSSVSDPAGGNNSDTDNNSLSGSADLSITKSDGASTSVPGGSISYTIVASNAGPSNAPSATVTDNFGPNFENCSWTCSGSGGASCPASGNGNINAGVNLPSGGSVSFIANCDINAGATGTLSNTASVSSPLADPTPGNNTNNDNNSLVANADLSITKTDLVSSVTAGDFTSYQISATNAGPSNVSNATVVDNFSSDFEACTWICSGSSGGSCPSAGNGNINASVNLPVDGWVDFIVDCAIESDATGTLSNTATISSAATDPVPGNNSSTDNNTILTSADLGITKTDGASSSTPGGSVTYTIIASNAGPSDAPGATVTDNFGPDFENCSWTCSGSGGGSCPASGNGNINAGVNLPEGGSVSFTASCDIDGDATGTLSNTASVSSGVSDPAPGNNSATDNNSLSGSADLAITKTDGSSESTPGESVVYTIVASNAGPTNVSNATVIDNFGSELENCAWTCSGSSGGSCPASGNDNINASVNLPVGGTATFTANCDIDASTTGSLSNTASVSSPLGDPNMGNNSATDVNALVVRTDLYIANSNGVNDVTPGTPISYSIIASNLGPSDAFGVDVVDNFPSELENCSWFCFASGGAFCNANGNGNLNTAVSLPVDGIVNFTVNCDVDSAATGMLANLASVSSSDEDPNLVNNSVTDTDTLTPRANVGITKTDGATTSAPGDSITYTIVASNTGPSDDISATVTDVFASDLNNCSWTCSGSGGASCPSGGSGNINEVVNLPDNSSATFLATCDIDPGATGTLSNTASILASVADPVASNNSATDINNLEASADLGITKTDGSTSSTPGGSVVYSIVASNAGPSDVANATVTDTFGPDFENCSWTCSSGGGASCPSSGSGNINESVSLPVGGNVTFTAGCDIAADATGTLSNTASVSSAIPDSNNGNNTATDNNSLSGEADLSISKTDGSSSVTPGSQVTYTITAGNTGPSNVLNANVTDVFPAELSSCSWTCLGAGGASCASSGAGDINETVNLPVFGSVIFTASCSLDGSATGTLSNTATISSALGDPQPGNNSATDNSNIDSVADLAITKTDGASTSTPGGSVIYTIVASNAGPSDVANATVVDSFGPDFNSCSWTCSGSNGGSCPASGAGNINASVSLPAGASTTFLASCGIDLDASGSLSNTASVSSSASDPVPGNNSATDVNSLVASADLQITKTDGSSTSTPGGVVTYTIVAGNAGPSNANSATVTDTFVDDLENCSWSCFGAGGGSCPANGSGDINASVSLPVGASVTFSATCDIDASAQGVLTNTAFVSSAIDDPVSGNNSASDNNSLGGNADLSITKTDGSSLSTPGNPITYTITAGNAGPSNVAGATVTDTFSSQFENCSWTCSGSNGGTCPASGSGDINENVGLPVGATVTFLASCDIASDATGSLVNTAEVSSALTDPITFNNASTDSNILMARADLQITKTDGATSSVPGGSVTYTIVASNAGPSDGAGVTVTDNFGSDFENCTWTCSGSDGGVCPASGSGNISESVTLPAGGSTTFVATCDIDDAASGTLSNTANVSGSGIDPSPGNNNATDNNSLELTADLGITKTDGGTSSTPGGSVVYTIVASNAGPSNVSNATVTDTFGPDFENCSWSCSASGGGSCPTSGSGNINASVNLPVGGTTTFTAACDIDAGATGVLSNTATVSSTVNDPVTGNNSATDNNSLGGTADLSITKTDGSSSSVPGESVTYTIVASNAGPSNAGSATVTDNFGPAFNSCSWTCAGSGGSSCPASGNGNINASVNLPAGSSATFTASCGIDSDATGTLSNTATVSSVVTDPVPANNSATDDNSLNITADLSITKSDGSSNSVPGGSVTYTIVAGNAGPSDENNATVSDLFGVDFENCSWTCSGTGGGVCPASGIDVINASVSLPAGASTTFIASCDIDSSASGTLSNTANVSGSGNDPVTSNNSATDVNQLDESADLSITKSDGSATSTPGGSVTYAIVASNAGPSAVAGATVTDNFGADFENCTWTCSGSGGASCPTSGSGNINALVDLPAGSNVSFSATCDIDSSASGVLSNTATVSSSVDDPVPGNNSDTDNNSLGGNADLSVIKTDGAALTVPGDSVTYTITASNAGPSDVSSATVADTFGPDFENCSWTCSGNSGGSCPASGTGDIDATVELPNGGMVTFLATCDVVSDATGTLSNTATVSSALSDPINSNNSSTDNNSLFPRADLQITKSDGATASTPGTPITYSIVASNAGPSDSSDITVTDSFGPDFENCSWTCSGDDGGICPASGTGNISETVTLPAGASTTFLASCDISDSASGTLSNTASVSGPALDPTPGNNSATDNNTLEVNADLSITKTDGQSEATAGESLTYTIVASNVGPSSANATVEDIFPAELENCSWTCSAASGASCPASGTGNINASVSLPKGSSTTFTATCDIDINATGIIANTATISSAVGDPDTGNNSATDETALEQIADLSITKTDDTDNESAGETLIYAIEVSNAGPSDDPAAVVSDLFPLGLENCEWVCDAFNGAACSASGIGDIDETVNLPAGSSTTFSAVCDIETDWSGTIMNTATVTASVTDPSTANNSDTDFTEIEPVTDLMISVTDGLFTGTPGESLEYTIIATNVGPNDVDTATVTDTFPPELLNCSWTCEGSNGGSCAVPSGAGNIDHDVTLPMNGSATFTATCDIDINATGIISNTAIVLSEILDNAPSNNMDTDTTSLDPDMLLKIGFE